MANGKPVGTLPAERAGGGGDARARGWCLGRHSARTYTRTESVMYEPLLSALLSSDLSEKFVGSPASSHSPHRRATTWSSGSD